MNVFYENLLALLKTDERFFSVEGEFLRNAVYEAAMKMDSDLLKLLYKNEATRDKFFTDVDGIFVFDKVGFGWVINNREFLPDSYTRYKNKIGLVNANGDYISTSNDISLVFPYKDCVLEGGQTKDDQKRSEIFYNETLAPDEVDRLLYPKVLTNAKRYTADGVEENIVNFDEDNLIVKGNNLLVISTLRKKYANNVDCIYIDPPYYFDKNKPADAFKYNSNFKLSTWLVFMKDRLLIAKDLLKDSGVIFCHIGEDGFHYLK
ncbi:MAG: site-specific DNA-methyltransferase, partial [Clostridia bacterium]|nr:site-specific DNA-methyltransferase [Clostridia bacterium]